MTLLNDNTLQSRRNFFSMFITSSAPLCFGCRFLFAQTNQEKMKHKFLSNAGMSYEEVFNYSYNQTFIPFLKWLGTEIGEKKMLVLIKKWIENTYKIKETQLNYDMKKFANVMKKPDTFYDHVTTYEVIEESEQAFEIKITECLWAKIFREANASSIGYLYKCYSDNFKIKYFNPKLKLVRTKTLMQGDDYCNPRFLLDD